MLKIYDVRSVFKSIDSSGKPVGMLGMPVKMTRKYKKSGLSWISVHSARLSKKSTIITSMGYTLMKL